MPSMPDDAHSSLNSLLRGYIVAAGLALAFRMFPDGLAAHPVKTEGNCAVDKDLGHAVSKPQLQNLAKA